MDGTRLDIWLECCSIHVPSQVSRNAWMMDPKHGCTSKLQNPVPLRLKLPFSPNRPEQRTLIARNASLTRGPYYPWPLLTRPLTTALEPRAVVHPLHRDALDQRADGGRVAGVAQVRANAVRRANAVLRGRGNEGPIKRT